MMAAPFGSEMSYGKRSRSAELVPENQLRGAMVGRTVANRWLCGEVFVHNTRRADDQLPGVPLLRNRADLVNGSSDVLISWWFFAAGPSGPPIAL